MEERQVVISTGNFIVRHSGGLRERYKIGLKLGDGAFGTVRKATNRVSKQERAVKIVSKRLLNTPEKAAWISNEIAALQALDHPNIMRLFETFEDERRFYLVTEYFTGGELYENVIRTGYLSEAKSAWYARQILSSVAYCHEKGVMHRDLKPDNFLLESEAADALLKVIDFGTATFYTSGQRFTEKIGTPYYIAPEVLKRNYTEKCDLWSVGVCLYILLCGFPPFAGVSDEQILKKVMKGRFDFPSPEWDLISYEAKDLVCRLLAYDPDSRISAREALAHPWIQTADMPTFHPVHVRAAFENLKQFANKLIFQKAVLTLITSQLCSKEDTEEMAAMFQSFDRDHSGTLSRSELITGFSLLFGRDSEEVAGEVDLILSQVDTDMSGEIDYTEFITASVSLQQILTKERLFAAFQVFDTDRNGTISASELKALLSGGRNYEDQVWIDLIREADQNGDGVIDFQEFLSLMTLR